MTSSRGSPPAAAAACALFAPAPSDERRERHGRPAQPAPHHRGLPPPACARAPRRPGLPLAGDWRRGRAYDGAHLRRAAAAGAGRGRAAAARGGQRAAGPAAVPPRAGLRRGLLRLPGCRRGRRARVPAQPGSHAAGAGAAEEHRAGRRRPLRDHHGPGAAHGSSAPGPRAGAGPAHLAGHRRPGRRAARRAPRAAGAGAGRPGVSAVHLWLHGLPQGRAGAARQRAAQRTPDRPRRGAAGGGRGCGLAADLPRHGPHRERHRASVRRRAVHDAVSHGLPAAPDALAAGHVALPRHLQRRAQLRLRPVQPQGHARGSRAPRPVPLASGFCGRRAGAGQHPGPLRRDLRPLWVPPRSLLRLLRYGRVHPVRHQHPPRPGAASAAPLEDRAAAGAGAPGGRRRVRRSAPRLVRRGLARPRAAHRRARAVRGAARADDRRDLAAQRQRGRRLLAPPGGQRADLRRPAGRRPGSLPAHRRLGLRVRRRALRHGPVAGPDHPGGPQPVPAGPGAHRGGRGAAPSARLPGGLQRGRRPAGAARGRRRSGQASGPRGRGAGGDGPAGRCGRCPRGAGGDRGAAEGPHRPEDLQRQDPAQGVPTALPGGAARGGRAARVGPASPRGAASSRGR